MAAPLSTLSSELNGRRYSEFKFHITPLWARQFKRCLGYSEEKIHDDSFLPDVFLSCLRDGEYAIFDDLKIDLSQLLHTTQSFKYIEKLHVGDHLVARPYIRRVMAKLKTAHPFVLLDISNEYFRDGKLVAESEGTLYVREPT